MTTEVMKQALDALSDFLALIKYQYSGSREAMSDLQYADNRAVFAVTALRQAISDASIDTSQSHSCTWPSCNPDEPGPVGEVVSYGSHLHPEWFSGRVPLLGTLLYTAPPAQAKEIEGLKAAARQALAVLKGCLEHPDADDAIAALNNAAIAQQTKETE